MPQASNTLPFVLLGGVIALRGIRQYLAVTGFTAVLSGVGTWLAASSSQAHVGASGVIFAYFGFLCSVVVFERPVQVTTVVVTAGVGFLYGGLVIGVFPSATGRDSSSWEMHLFGLASGVLAAFVYYGYWLRKQKLDAEKWERVAMAAESEATFDDDVTGSSMGTQARVRPSLVAPGSTDAVEFPGEVERGAGRDARPVFAGESADGDADEDDGDERTALVRGPLSALSAV